MTDRQKRMIETYLPHPRDKDLGDGEYYVRDTAGRVRRAWPANIWLHRDEVTYDMYECSSKRRIESGWYDPFRGFTKGYLYDNKEDCRAETHDLYDGWEELRKIQEEENDT